MESDETQLGMLLVDRLINKQAGAETIPVNVYIHKIYLKQICIEVLGTLSYRTYKRQGFHENSYCLQ